jgi:hypothetical protein
MPPVFKAPIISSANIETRGGMQQRAAAVEKALRYDDLVGTRVRRGGMFKGVMFWPIKPTDGEIGGAAELANRARAIPGRCRPN